MKFHNSVGPNPQVVRMFAAEKGIALDKVEVDLMGGENRQPPYLEKNPSGQLPCLEMDNGDYLSEITVICEYLEEKYPNPPLIGSNAEERALTRMWTRKIDLSICEPLANGFRFSEGLPLFKDRMITVPEAAEGLKSIARDRLAWLNGLMAGKQFICGDRISLADVLLYCFLTFGKSVGQPVQKELSNITAWLDRMGARPSASA